jgi:hypothetical protein
LGYQGRTAFFFVKKKQKLSPLLRGLHRQKFFGSFFQKRTAFLGGFTVGNVRQAVAAPECAAGV